MALEKILEIYLNHGESTEVIDQLKEIGVCLETFFNEVQLLKAEINSKVFFKDIYKASGTAAFDENGKLQTNFVGPQIKMIYTYFNGQGEECNGFMLIN